MSYRVELDARADKQAEKVDRETLKRLQKRFRELAQNPFVPRISKPLTMSADRRTYREFSEMKPSLLQRTIATIILIAALLPVSLAFGGLPGPPPPAPPPIPTPPPDSEFDYVKVDDARGQAGVAEQIELGTDLKDKIIQYGGTDNILQSIECRSRQ